MKTIKILGLALLSLFLYTSCEDTTDEFNSEQNLFEENNLTSKSSNKKGLPFKASFTVWRAETPGSQPCDAGSSETMIMKGKGEMTHLGQLQELFMRFCSAPTPEVIFPVNYSFIETGKFVAANGDELHCVIESGQIWPYSGDNPQYQLYLMTISYLLEVLAVLKVHPDGPKPMPMFIRELQIMKGRILFIPTSL